GNLRTHLVHPRGHPAGPALHRLALAAQLALPDVDRVALVTHLVPLGLQASVLLTPTDEPGAGSRLQVGEVGGRLQRLPDVETFDRESLSSAFGGSVEGLGHLDQRKETPLETGPASETGLAYDLLLLEREGPRPPGG